MASFALITEGITDQAVLENILIGIYGDDVEVKPLQPLRDATDACRAKQNSLGGWEQVFEYCQHGDFNEVFMFNDYVIIQIDTDIDKHANFGISLTHHGKDRPTEELVDEVRQLLILKLNPAIYEQFQEKFKFAIAVRSLECWLLPLYAEEKAHIVKTKNCAKQLERDTKRLKLDYRKVHRVYDNLSRKYQSTKEIEKGIQHQKSLAIFIDSLPIP